MRLLLDTHVFLWFRLNDPRLSSTAASLIADPANERFVSTASFWELAIKVSIGKYSFPRNFRATVNQALAAMQADEYQVELHHSERLATLPLHHKDPFDRMIAAQALADSLTLVSADLVFDQYGINRLW